MSHSKSIILALRGFWETAYSLVFPVCMKSFSTTGKDLVDVSLMSDIPDNPVFGSIEDIMQGNGEFDHSKTGSEMPGIGGYNVDDEFP